MPRPPIERSVAGVPRITLFKPAGVPARELDRLRLAVDELEAIRLVDLEGLSHEQAAEALGVSRQTVGRVLERGRAKVADALVGGKAIEISGGQYRVEPQKLRCFACQEQWGDGEHGGRTPAVLPAVRLGRRRRLPGPRRTLLAETFGGRLRGRGRWAAAPAMARTQAADPKTNANGRRTKLIRSDHR